MPVAAPTSVEPTLPGVVAGMTALAIAAGFWFAKVRLGPVRKKNRDVEVVDLDVRLLSLELERIADQVTRQT